jgi:hypothetical protein
VPKKSKRVRRVSQASKLKKLKKLSARGLYAGDTSRLTDYGGRILRRFADVLRGAASVIGLPSLKASKPYRDNPHLRVRGKKVIVPRRKGERVRYDRKTGQIKTRRREYDRSIETIIPSSPIERASIAPSGEKIQYAIPIGGPGHVERFDTYADLDNFMRPYEFTHIVSDKYGVRPVSYLDWRQHVNIERVRP